MKGRKQNIVKLSGQSEQRVEPGVMIGMQTFMEITENRLTAFKQKEGGLLEYILSPVNLNLAYKQVKSNKGSGGVDKVEVEELLSYLQDSIRKMKDKIRELTSRNNGWGYAYRKQRLSWYIRGWLNYFKLAGFRHRIMEWDGWLRRRIRLCIWKS